MSHCLSLIVLSTLSLIVLGKPQVPDLGPQLSQAISFDNVRFTECNEFIQTCAPTISSCAASLCQQCTGLGLGNCCDNDPAPTACFATALLQGGRGGGGGGGNSAPLTTAAIAPGEDSRSLSGPDACSSQLEFIDICQSLTPTFNDISDFSSQAPCLCYSDQSWMPSIYDGYASQCSVYVSSASPAAYASITAADGSIPSAPCQAAGDVLNGGARASTPMRTGGGGTTSGGHGGGSSTYHMAQGSSGSTGAASERAGNLFTHVDSLGIKVAMTGLATVTLLMAVLL